MAAIPANMANILEHVTGNQQRHNPYYIPHLAEHIKGFLSKAKSFRNIETHQKPREGVPSTSSPSYHGGRGGGERDFAYIRPRVNGPMSLIIWRSNEFSMKELSANKHSVSYCTCANLHNAYHFVKNTYNISL